jgi:peptidoglycan/LPS O-acetylase OafA/YrhL
MDSSSDSPRSLQSVILPWVLGALGITALIKFLPRTIIYAIRRWVFGLIAEIVMVVIAGLLTEKLVDRLTTRNGVDHSVPRTQERRASGRRASGRRGAR